MNSYTKLAWKSMNKFEKIMLIISNLLAIAYLVILILNKFQTSEWSSLLWAVVLLLLSTIYYRKNRKIFIVILVTSLLLFILSIVSLCLL